jgi:EmrB/QacA subfamily drug resistance transporter
VGAETRKPSQADQELQMSVKRRRMVAIGVGLGMFVAALEMTAVGTAMPTVIASLGGMKHYSWVFSAYLLTSTVTMPLWGKLSDIYGRRLLYQLGIWVFLAGSVLSGLSTSMPQLILSRALQGLGAGALVPLGMTIIGTIYSYHERARMQGFFSGVWGFASVVGPAIGGFLTDQISWRWIFYINLPFGLLAGATVWFAMKEPRSDKRPVIDYAGAIALTASITMLMLVLVVRDSSLGSILSSSNLLLLAGATILLVLFTRIERRAVEPLIPLELFRNRVVSITVITKFLAGAAMFGAISFVPLFAQGTMGATATEAGTLLTALLLGWVACAIIGGRLLPRVGHRRAVITGLSLLTIGFAILTIPGRISSRGWLIADMAVMGAGIGLTMFPLIIVIQQVVPRNHLGVATSLIQFSRSIGGAVGVAIMGVVLTAGLGASLSASPDSHRLLPLSEGMTKGMDTADRSAVHAEVAGADRARVEANLAAALQRVFLIGGAFAGLALIVVVCCLPRSECLSRVDSSRSTYPPEPGEQLSLGES